MRSRRTETIGRDLRRPVSFLGYDEGMIRMSDVSSLHCRSKLERFRSSNSSDDDKPNSSGASRYIFQDSQSADCIYAWVTSCVHSMKPLLAARAIRRLIEYFRTVGKTFTRGSFQSPYALAQRSGPCILLAGVNVLY